MEEVVKPGSEQGPKKSWFRKFLRKFILFSVVILVLYLGIVYIFKTNEGILKTGFVNIGNTSTPNEEWQFSVVEDSVANQITNLDQRIAVKLYYKEYYTTLFFRGDTKYFVYKMDKMPSP